MLTSGESPSLSQTNEIASLGGYASLKIELLNEMTAEKAPLVVYENMPYINKENWIRLLKQVKHDRILLENRAAIVYLFVSRMTGLVVYVLSSINKGSRLRTYIQPSKIKHVSGELLKEWHKTDR